MHKPFRISNLALGFAHKLCFQDFNAEISYGERIAIIGNNGSGKSSLLKLLMGKLDSLEGRIVQPADCTFGYVPQIINDFDSQSGGQRFNTALTKALAPSPNILLLDEPTNHLDQYNRKALFRLLDAYPGTLIIVSHDQELLRRSVNTLWHIKSNKISVFTGNYDDYCQELAIQYRSVHEELTRLATQKKESHKKLMKEQERTKKRKTYGEKKYGDDKLALRSAQGRGQATANKNRKNIAAEKESILEQLKELQQPEIIKIKFSLSTGQLTAKNLITINSGLAGYHNPILSQINFSLSATERLAIVGSNGSGKTTLIKAILSQASLRMGGEWFTPKPGDIGYLDQHYSTLSNEQTVFDAIADLGLNWHPADIRRHLNYFLFRKNEEINKRIADLSGGEKARLCLAQIAAKTPRLLILDEITNNLDLQTKEQIIQVLNEFPAAMIVISHDKDFLEAIKINRRYLIEKECKLALS
ncbi:putative ABC transporter ATP-binding protein YheS [Legionella massiliensis]|uniref:Putative ABC transporter ATP-binding protein YheS n=1 Tax=Legionella massiliensis TaxID=1034943 RepID=A0A078L0D2_9GAMM|nr:ATP-binding cassette domain-containing protein [Legionella massiliensis]CDZ78722.1 putative ABC transporter ATP-binding protein YheS [Legionella massiliensis]CEE14460.1 putative ABC transporter ATP-binding protein YheS [Legionella massiliensis]